MKQYHDLLKRVLEQGEHHDDRTGVGTIRKIGDIIEFDLRDGFPAVTTKKLAWKSVIGELLWFIVGSTNVYELAEITHGDSDKRTIWTDNYENQAKALGYCDGYLGPVYGAQWREFDDPTTTTGTRVDQLQEAIDTIKTNPNSRRIIVSAWNPLAIPDMALPPCHLMFMFSVTDGHLNLTWVQRSCDTFLGIPFNIASYAALCHIIASICDLKPGKLVGLLHDVHVYKNHVEQVKELLSREPRELPTLVMPEVKSLTEVYDLTPADFVLTGYDPHPAITAPMAV